MTLEIIAPTISQICDKAVEALDRFYALTELDPTKVPECFIASYVFDHLGRESRSEHGISMAPEITIADLARWDASAQDIDPESLPEEPEGGQKRVDLVLFRPAPVKSEESLLALVEFKRNWRVDDDIKKLRNILSVLRTCEYGAACGVVEPSKYPGWFDAERAARDTRGMLFLTSSERVITVDQERRTFVVFAYLFGKVEQRSDPIA